jgi:hypothetical protein
MDAAENETTSSGRQRPKGLMAFASATFVTNVAHLKRGARNKPGTN